MKINTTITIEKETKEEALKLLGSQGQKLSTVVELFLRRIILEAKQNGKSKRGITAV